MMEALFLASGLNFAKGVQQWTAFTAQYAVFRCDLALNCSRRGSQKCQDSLIRIHDPEVLIQMEYRDRQCVEQMQKIRGHRHG